MSEETLDQSNTGNKIQPQYTGVGTGAPQLWNIHLETFNLKKKRFALFFYFRKMRHSCNAVTSLRLIFYLWTQRTSITFGLHIIVIFLHKFTVIFFCNSSLLL